MKKEEELNKISSQKINIQYLEIKKTTTTITKIYSYFFVVWQN